MSLLALYEERPVESIVGREPSWIIRGGISLIAIVFIILLMMTWFIRYPDTINSEITITTLQPPTEIVSKVSGQILQLNVTNNERVKSGQSLLLVDSNVNYQQLQMLEQQLLILKITLESPARFSFDVGIINSYQMGDLQPGINRLSLAINQLILETHSKQLATHISNAELLSFQYRRLQQQLSNKELTWKKKLALEENILDKKIALSTQGITTSAELLPLQMGLLDKQIALDDIIIQSNLYEIKLSELSQSVNEFKMQHQEKHQQLKGKILNELSTLFSEIANWKQRYLITAPVDGQISFSQIWSVNQYIRAGEIILTVANTNKEIIGKTYVNHFGAGKIKLDQRVDIELASYPSLEYGQLVGRVKSISLVPGEQGYLVDVALNPELLTTYGKKLTFSPNLIGNAKIINAEKRLFERFLEKILYTFS